MQVLTKLLEKSSVSSLEGHVGYSSQTKVKIPKLTDKNDIEAYLTTSEHLIEAHKIDKSC